MKITCPIFKTSTKYPDLVAIRDNDQILTYKQLNDLVEKYALIFNSFDIQPGNRVALYSKNSIEYVISIFALIRIGVPFVPLNLRWSEAAIKNSIRESNCSIFFTDLENAIFQNKGFECFLFKDINSFKSGDSKSPDKFTITTFSPECEMAIFFTSGSSGKPKGAILTIGNFYYSALGSNKLIHLEKDDCWLVSLPFYHVGGLAILFRCFLAGASVYILPDFKQQNLLNALKSQKITHISLVPAMLGNLVNSENIDCLKKLKSIILGGSFATEKTISKIKKDSLPVFITYGMTETASQVTCLDIRNPLNGTNSAGKCLPYREVSILDEKGKQLSENQEGEIAVRGKILFRGYLNEVKKYDSTSWFKTGDVGYLDNEENLVIKGRKDDLIISGGENIYPAEIENVVQKYPGITNSCVLGVEDSKWGQRPVLFLETEDPSLFDKDKLIQFLKEYLSKLFLPDKIYVLTRFPQKSIGKVDKEGLLELLKKRDL